MPVDWPWDVVVVGGANWDFLIRGPKLPGPGDTVRGDEFQEAPGGKGANQAVASARLGAAVAMVARVGSDLQGERVIAKLESERVNAQYVIRDGRAETAVALVQVRGDGQKQILAIPGANSRLSVADVEAATSLLASTAVLLMQLEPPVDAVIAAARLAQQSGALVVLDPSPAVPLPDALLELVYLIRPNADKATTLTGVAVGDRTTAATAAEQLLERGVQVAVVQAGDAGDLMVWREKGRRCERWLPRFPVAAIDATGAGDAFAAALAVMIAKERPLAEAGLFGSAAAALTTTRLGAQAALPTKADVDAFIRPHASIVETAQRI